MPWKTFSATELNIAFKRRETRRYNGVSEWFFALPTSHLDTTWADIMDKYSVTKIDSPLANQLGGYCSNGVKFPVVIQRTQNLSDCFFLENDKLMHKCFAFRDNTTFMEEAAEYRHKGGNC